MIDLGITFLGTVMASKRDEHKPYFVLSIWITGSINGLLQWQVTSQVCTHQPKIMEQNFLCSPSDHSDSPCHQHPSVKTRALPGAELQRSGSASMNKILRAQLSRENPVEMENNLNLQLWLIIQSVPELIRSLSMSPGISHRTLRYFRKISRPGEASLLQMSCSTQAAFTRLQEQRNERRWVRKLQHWLTTVGKELCHSEEPRIDLRCCFSRTDRGSEDVCAQIPHHEVPRQEHLLVNQSHSDLQNSKFAHFPWTGRLRKIPRLLPLFFAQLQLSCSFSLIKNSISDPLFDRLQQGLHPTICSHSSLHNQDMEMDPSFLLSLLLLLLPALHHYLGKTALLFLPKLVPCCLPQLGTGTKTGQTNNSIINTVD